MSAEPYLVVKWVHIGCAILSIAGFGVRGALMLAGSVLLDTRVARIAPHVIDTVLLASAVALTVSLEQYPFVHGWLTAKLLALLAYIVLGTIALKRGRSRPVRALAFAGALATVLYIVSVAATRDARGVLAWTGWS